MCCHNLVIWFSERLQFVKSEKKNVGSRLQFCLVIKYLKFLKATSCCAKLTSYPDSVLIMAKSLNLEKVAI